MEFGCEVEIKAAAGQIFPWLEDPERMRLWVKGLEYSEYLSPSAALGVGTRFRQRMREMGRTVTYEGEILQREPPARLVVALMHHRFEMRVHYRLTGSQHGTHLRYDLHLRPMDSTVARLEQAMGWMLERNARQQLIRLKDCSENAARTQKTQQSDENRL